MLSLNPNQRDQNRSSIVEVHLDEVTANILFLPFRSPYLQGFAAQNGFDMMRQVWCPEFECVQNTIEAVGVNQRSSRH